MTATSREVGYLHYSIRMGLGTGNLEGIKIVGNTALADCRRRFRPHDAIHRQRQWQLPGIETYLKLPEAIA